MNTKANLLKLKHFMGSIARGRPLRVHVGNYRLWAPAYLGSSFKAFLTYGEPFTIELFQRVIKPGTVIFDIVANIGIYTVFGAMKTGERGKVYAFEPDPRNYKYLVWNVRSHHLVNVLPVAKALANVEGGITLYMHADPTSSRIVESSWRAEGIVGTRVVKVSTLDKFAKEHRISNIDVLKIDVEGAELSVIEGGKETLKHLPSVAIFFELAPKLITKPKIIELLKLLKALDFQTWLIDEDGKRLLENVQSYVEDESMLGESKVNALALKGTVL